MTIILNDPSWWPLIDMNRSYSYFIVAATTMVVYDWVLTIEKEVDLIWRQRWSFMTLLYFSVRYMGMVLLSVIVIMETLPVVSLTDMGCTIVSQIFEWAGVVINAMLEVIMIARLYAMYRQSRRMLIFLTVAFLAVTLACGVISATNYSHSSMEEFILSGIYDCIVTGASPLLLAETWILATVWEVLTLFLTAWVALKHFRELQRRPTGLVIGDILTVLIKYHMFYFSGFAISSCFILCVTLSPKLSNLLFFNGALPITGFARMFVLGPRLILSVREYHAERLANADVGTGMNMSAFQEHIHLSTGGDV